MNKKTKSEERNCVVCGAPNPEYYFGTVELPDKETGEHVKTGESYEGFDIVEWTGDYIELEYWECDDCFSQREC